MSALSSPLVRSCSRSNIRAAARFEIEIDLQVEGAFERLLLEFVEQLRIEVAPVAERILAEYERDDVDAFAGAHEGSAPRLPLDELPLNEMLQAFVDRDRRHMVEPGEFDGRRQAGFVGQLSRDDPVRQMIGDLLLQRRGGVGFEGDHFPFS